MNKMQEKSFQLLLELDRICKENEIEYYLHSSTARMAFCSEGFEDGVMSVAIEMTVQASQKLIAVLEKNLPQGRFLEHMGNSPQLHLFSMRYIDTDTTYYPIKTYGNYLENGIGVYIWIIRRWYDKPLTRMALLATEVGWELNSYCSPRKLSAPYLMSKVLMAPLIAIWGRKRMSKFLYKFWNKHYAADGSNFGIRSSKQSYKHYSNSFFNSTTLLNFEGHRFPGLGNIEAYLTQHQGKNWKKAFGKGLKPISGSVMVNPDIGYKEVEKRLDEDKINLTQLARQNRKVQKILFNRKKHFLRKKQNYSLALAVRSELITEAYYRERREYLQTLYDNYEYRQLWIQFKRYHAIMIKNSRTGAISVVDEDIFKIYLHILQLYGKAAFAKRLTKLHGNSQG